MQLDNAGTKPFIIQCYDQVSRLLISVILELPEPNRHEKEAPATVVTVRELADHPEALAPDERDFAKRSDFVKKWQAGLLRSPEQLYDVGGDQITLFWDTDQDTQEIKFALKTRSLATVARIRTL